MVCLWPLQTLVRLGKSSRWMSFSVVVYGLENHITRRSVSYFNGGSGLISLVSQWHEHLPVSLSLVSGTSIYRSASAKLKQVSLHACTLHDQFTQAPHQTNQVLQYTPSSSSSSSSSNGAFVYVAHARHAGSARQLFQSPQRCMVSAPVSSDLPRFKDRLKR